MNKHLICKLRSRFCKEVFVAYMQYFTLIQKSVIMSDNVTEYFSC